MTAAGGTVTFRLGWRQIPWPVLVTGLPLAFGPGRDGRPWSDRVPYLLVYAALTGAMLVAFRHRFRTELRPGSLVIQGVRRTEVPWRDVVAIDVRRVLGTSKVYVVVRGLSTALRAPTHTPFLGPDAEFDAKVETVNAYWVTGRDRTPEPA